MHEGCEKIRIAGKQPGIARNVSGRDILLSCVHLSFFLYVYLRQERFVDADEARDHGVLRLGPGD
jgi:hypothetical protein